MKTNIVVIFIIINTMLISLLVPYVTKAQLSELEIKLKAIQDKKIAINIDSLVVKRQAQADSVLSISLPDSAVIQWPNIRPTFDLDDLPESWFYIGVIPQTQAGCPYVPVRIFMDNEDVSNDNPDNLHDGWNGIIEYDDQENITLKFCKVDGRKFKPLSSGEIYAAVKFGYLNPPGSLEFSRYFDNEDCENGGNINEYEGDIFPNWMDKNTHLHFCLFAPALINDEMEIYRLK